MSVKWVVITPQELFPISIIGGKSRDHVDGWGFAIWFKKRAAGPAVLCFLSRNQKSMSATDFQTSKVLLFSPRCISGLALIIPLNYILISTYIPCESPNPCCLQNNWRNY